MNIVRIECAVNGCGGCYIRPQFAADPDRHVLVSSLRTGGVGLNLTAASVVFHFDRWWNPAVETQAEDRAHRIGQTRPVQVFAYLTPDSIEQRIGEILDEKRALFDDIIEQLMACAVTAQRSFGGPDAASLHRLRLQNRGNPAVRFSGSSIGTAQCPFPRRPKASQRMSPYPVVPEPRFQGIGRLSVMVAHPKG
jgi:hypothetical protein